MPEIAPAISGVGMSPSLQAALVYISRGPFALARAKEMAGLWVFGHIHHARLLEKIRRLEGRLDRFEADATDTRGVALLRPGVRSIRLSTWILHKEKRGGSCFTPKERRSREKRRKRCVETKSENWGLTR